MSGGGFKKSNIGQRKGAPAPPIQLYPEEVVDNCGSHPRGWLCAWRVGVIGNEMWAETDSCVQRKNTRWNRPCHYHSDAQTGCCRFADFVV